MSRQGFGKVAVLLGGNSEERDVSLSSGEAIYEALLRQGIDAVKVDTKANAVSQLESAPFDRAFIALHGKGGEDGSIQGLLEFLGIPYTGTGVKGSAICMDKWRTKLVWQGCGLPTPPYEMVDSVEGLTRFAEKVGFPIMIKPALEGSSIGITKVDNFGQLQQALEYAQVSGSPVMAERFVKGREFTVGVLGDQVLPAIQLRTDHTFYDFEAKYESETTEYLLPCGLCEKKESELKNLVMKAYSVAGCSGWGRLDVMEDEQGNFWLIEANTVPGMTDHSLVPMAAKAMDMDFDELVLSILETAR